MTRRKAKDFNRQINDFLYHPTHGWVVVVGLVASLTIVIGAGVSLANANYPAGLLLFITGIFVMKPSLLYFAAWVDDRLASQNRSKRVLSTRNSDG